MILGKGCLSCIEFLTFWSELWLRFWRFILDFVCICWAYQEKRWNIQKKRDYLHSFPLYIEKLSASLTKKQITSYNLWSFIKNANCLYTLSESFNWKRKNAISGYVVVIFSQCVSCEVRTLFVSSVASTFMDSVKIFCYSNQQMQCKNSWFFYILGWK
jgi:hypothetical protein